MALYKDLITGDEMLNSYFDTKEIDDTVYAAEGRFRAKKGDDNFDIGANPSAEGGDEEGFDSAPVEQVLDIVDNFRLQKADAIVTDKKAFAGLIKAYLGKLDKVLEEKGKSAEERKKVSDQIKEFCKKVVKDFKQYEFYTGESMNPDGMLVMLHWTNNSAGDEVPMFYVWKHGVSSEKM